MPCRVGKQQFEMIQSLDMLKVLTGVASYLCCMAKRLLHSAQQLLQ